MEHHVVEHTFNPSIQKAKTMDLCEFQTSLVYLYSKFHVSQKKW